MSIEGMSRWWGPVFDAERTIRARQWQGYALRSGFVAGLLLGLMLVFSNATVQSGPVTVQQMAQIGRQISSTVVFIELVAVLLIAPAATAGAICLDKTRGSLAHVFVTDLTDREIVLGKLAARLFPVWGLLACALPVSAAATLLGGIDPMALTGAFVIAAGVAILGCSFALMLSVWASKPHEVIAVVFGIWALWVLACPVYQICYLFGGRPPTWLEWSNPFYLAFSPSIYPGETSLLEPILFSLGCGLIGTICTAIAVRKVRVVGCRSARVAQPRAGRVGRGVGFLLGQWRRGRGPQLDANPVLWREWHRNRPSWWSRVVWLGYAVISALAGLTLIANLLNGTRPGMISQLAGSVLGLLATLGLLLVSTATASVLAEERARGSLDVLMSTPVSTRAILGAKWRGAFRRVPWLAFWPVVIGALCYLRNPMSETTQVAIIAVVPLLIVAQGAALVSLGLALATWIKRPGQATAWTITGLVFMVVGWPVLSVFSPLALVLIGVVISLVMTIIRIRRSKQALAWAMAALLFATVFWPIASWLDHTSHQTVIRMYGVVLGSPIVNVTMPLSFSLNGQFPSRLNIGGILLLVVAWTVFYGLGAWLLFELTVRTFDRCLGRIPERPSPPRPGPTEEPPPRRAGLIRGWDRKTHEAPGRPLAHAESLVTPPH